MISVGSAEGEHDIQLFVNDVFLKCFCNAALSGADNIAINHDQYHPALCSRNTIEQVDLGRIDEGSLITHEPEFHTGPPCTVQHHGMLSPHHEVPLSVRRESRFIVGSDLFSDLLRVVPGLHKLPARQAKRHDRISLRGDEVE